MLLCNNLQNVGATTCKTSLQQPTFLFCNFLQKGLAKNSDVVTPREIRYEFPMILEERKIPFWSYNLETILGEKIQTVLNRGILNTRMRDFYDIHILIKVYGSQISEAVLKAAYEATAKKRETTELLGRAEEILSIVEGDEHMIGLWKAYCKKYSYASGIAYEEVISSARTLISMIES